MTNDEPRQPTDIERQKIADHIADNRNIGADSPDAIVREADIAVWDNWTGDAPGEPECMAVILWPSAVAECWTIAEVARPTQQMPEPR